MTHTHHSAAHGDQRSRSKAEFFSTQQKRNRHVASAHELAICFQLYVLAQTVFAKHLMCFRQAYLPWQARMMHTAQRSCPRAAFSAGDQDAVSACLGHAACNDANARGGNQLHSHICLFVRTLKIINQLRQILDRINVMMRRWRNQRDALCGTAGSRHISGYLLSRQMAAFTWLCALGHFDLNLFCRLQILARHAKPGAGHLLDGGVKLRTEPFRPFAALTAVAPAAQAIHGDRHAFMSFPRDGAVGHRACFEATDDLFNRLDFFQRNRCTAFKAKIQQRTNGTRAIAFDHLCILVKQLFTVCPYRLLQRMNHLRRIEMFLSRFTFAQAMYADAIQHRVRRGLICPLMMPTQISFNVLQSNTAQLVRRIGKIVFHQRDIQAKRFKKLCTLICLQCGYTHLGCNLLYTGSQRLIILLDACFLLAEGFDAFVCQIWTYCPCAECNQRSQLMNVSRLTAFQKDGYSRTLLLPNQMLFQRRNSQKGRNGHMRAIYAPIRKNHDVCAGGNGTIAGGAEFIHRVLQR